MRGAFKSSVKAGVSAAYDSKFLVNSCLQRESPLFRVLNSPIVGVACLFYLKLSTRCSFRVFTFFILPCHLY